MTTYYVSSVDGDNADNGTTWALAVATLEYAVETLAATGGPHTILVDSAHSESLVADATITAAQDLRIISVNRSGSDAPLAGAVIGSQATNYAITLAGAFDVYMYGVEFRLGTGASAKNVSINSADGGHFELDQCRFVPTGSSASNTITIGGGGAAANVCTKLIDCTAKFSATGQSMRLIMAGEAINLTIDAAGSAPTSFLTLVSNTNGANWKIIGSDLSKCTGTLVGDAGGNGTAFYEFRQCKLGSGVTPLATPTSVLNRGQTTVTMYDCNSGDTHCAFFHSDAFGTTIQDAGIYATAGAQSGGSNVSYKIVTRASNCSYYTPYTSPWIAKYHTGTSAVTPSFEVLRDGSATAYQDDEVWGEWQYKGTSGAVTLTTVSDRMALLGPPADQTTGALAAGDWTGENATAWFGKLHTASTITPAEVGHIYGRVVVGEPSLTIYVDPTIRLT